MKALCQRVSSARVLVDGAPVATTGPGLCVLLGVAAGDGEQDARRLARRVALLRVFENELGRLDRSLVDIGGSALVVSQFTLIAETDKGNRPSFSGAASPEVAEGVYRSFVHALEGLGVVVTTGVFGARMLVEIANDGPVTVMLET